MKLSISALLARRESNDKIIERETDMCNAITYRINNSNNALEIDELRLESQTRRKRIYDAEIDNREIQAEIDKIR